MFFSFSRLPSSLCHCSRFQMGVPGRRMSFIQKLVRIQPQNRLLDLEKHKVVYEFPYIKIPVAVLRLKYSFPVFTSIFAPVIIYLNGLNSVTVAVLGMCAVQIPLFLALTKSLSNIVGKIYVNKAGDIEEILISVVDKTGRRQDHKHSINEVTVLESFTVLQERLSLASLSVKDSDVKFKLFTRGCKVHDEQACTSLFGKKLTQIMKLHPA